MARSYVTEGDIVDFTNNTAAAILSGDVVPIGYSHCGIAQVDIAINAIGALLVKGVVRLAKAAGAIVQGQKLWWDPTALNVLNAPALNSYFLGYAYKAALTGATSIEVELAPFAEEGPRVLTLPATGDHTLNVGDLAGGALALFVPNTAAKTINLPPVASVPPGAELFVKKTTADAFAITLDPNGSEQIAGAASHNAIDTANESAAFSNSGAAWLLK